MKFGVTVVPRVSDWKLFVDLETMGYDAAWAADSQMLYSDAYAVLALAAANTSRIRLGTGVSVAGVRLAPVTAHSIATINKLAPGRIFLGIGTGHTAMRVMGKDPVKAARVPRIPARAARAAARRGGRLRAGRRRQAGERTDIRFLHPDAGFIDVDHPVPIYVAADGPLALKTAGAYGDGRVCSHNQTRARLQKSLEAMQQGAAAVGRTLPGDFHTAALSYACVLRPGESMTSDRVIDEIGPMAAATLHYWWELYEKDGDTSTVAGRCRNLWDEYLAFTEKMETPPAKRYQQVHLGHCAFLPPEERRFITEDLIRSTGGLVGTPDEIIAMLREREAMGLNEITLLPAMAEARRNLEDFAQESDRAVLSHERHRPLLHAGDRTRRRCAHQETVGRRDHHGRAEAYRRARTAAERFRLCGGGRGDGRGPGGRSRTGQGRADRAAAWRAGDHQGS